MIVVNIHASINEYYSLLSFSLMMVGIDEYAGKEKSGPPLMFFGTKPITI